MSRGRSISIKKLLGVLNEPFMLCLFSSVVVGFVSRQYAEIQRTSMEREADDQVVRRAKIELGKIRSNTPEHDWRIVPV